VFSVTIPPLRVRPKDIGPLADFFLKRFSIRLNRRVGPLREETKQRLISYSWPGNVRELQNEIERLVLLAEPENEIGPEFLSEYLNQRPRSIPRPEGDLKTAVHHLEEEMLRDTMKRCQNNKSKAARVLGISRQSLIEKLKRIHL
jgi:transcriptional regulator with PAS, ATPase and Fis domain